MMTRWFFLIAAITLMAGCGGGDKTTADKGGGGKLNVVTTTMQTGDLVREVGGEHVQVTTLMGPGIDPHQYKASAGDVDRLGRADLIVYNGVHLEAKMADVLERLGHHKPTLAAGEAIPEDELITTDGAHDPHVWFDVARWRLALDAVAARLQELDPTHAADYQANAARYREELTALHEYCRFEVQKIPVQQRILITAHDAFNYLGRAYGLEVVGLQGISTLAEAGTSDVQDLAELIARRKIPALFVETSVSPRAIEAVREAVRARGFDVKVGGSVYSDAMGDLGTPEGTYVGMVRHNIDTIVKSLGGKEQP
ncbi:MAG: zinc ABC transporter substrate-binding protein [Candidatus Krumholzibacteriia bacterium]